MSITLGQYQTLHSIKRGSTCDYADGCDCAGCNDVRLLEDRGLLDIADDGTLTLTAEGQLSVDPRWQR